MILELLFIVFLASPFQHNIGKITGTESSILNYGNFCCKTGFYRNL